MQCEHQNHVYYTISGRMRRSAVNSSRRADHVDAMLIVWLVHRPTIVFNAMQVAVSPSALVHVFRMLDSCTISSVPCFEGL